MPISQRGGNEGFRLSICWGWWANESWYCSIFLWLSQEFYSAPVHWEIRSVPFHSVPWNNPFQSSKIGLCPPRKYPFRAIPCTSLHHLFVCFTRQQTLRFPGTIYRFTFIERHGPSDVGILRSLLIQMVPELWYRSKCQVHSPGHLFLKSVLFFFVE